LGAINGISLRVERYFLIIYYFSLILYNAQQQYENRTKATQTGEHNATKERIIHLSKEAENAGCFDSLWVLERLIWPINPQTPYPGT